MTREEFNDGLQKSINHAFETGRAPVSLDFLRYVESLQAELDAVAADFAAQKRHAKARNSEWLG